MPIIPAIAAAWRHAPSTPARLGRRNLRERCALVAVFSAALLQVAARTYNPFIYFRF